MALIGPMKNSIALGLNIFLLLLVACEQTPHKQTQDKLSQRAKKEVTHFPLVIDPAEVFTLEKFSNQLQIIESKNDPVYHQQTKRYEGIDFRQVLAHYLNLEALHPEDITLIFECNDDYKIAMPLKKALSHHAYLAFRDVDAPKGEKWIPIEKDGKVKSPAPYFLVWTDAPEEDYSFVRPYGLLKIILRKTP